MLIKMRKPLAVSLDGITGRKYVEGDVIDAPEVTALGLVEQGIAEFVEKPAMTRTTEPEEESRKKDKGPAPENKDEGRAPKNKEDEETGFKKKIRVHELAKQIGVNSADVLLKAAELGYDEITRATHLVGEEQAATLVRAFD